VAASLESFFLPEGPLACSTKTFEVRPEQREMAMAVGRALAEKKHLLVEAGTGVGKSFAYLLPCALWAVQQKKRVVIATYTKALQEQLIRKDLPIVEAALRHAGFEFSYALLMGAENYLCQQRLERCLGKEKDLFATTTAEETLANLHRWCGEATTGLRTKIPFKVSDPLWESVCRDSDICLGKKGPYWETCLYRKDMDRARAANVLVVNQHLFLAGGRLPSFEAVVIDEAHNLEKVAAQFLGLAFTNRKLKRLLDDFYNPQSNRGLARRLRGAGRLWFDQVRKSIGQATSDARIFFEAVRSKLGDSLTKRIKEPSVVADTLSPSLTHLVELLGQAVGTSQDSEEEAEIKALKARYLAAILDLTTFLKCESKDHAYWMESMLSRKTPLTSLNVVPLDVSATLKKELFEKHKPVILTSATLAVEKSFAMAKSRLGVGEGLEKWLDSPYDYPHQAAIYTDSAIPDPKDEPETYEKMVLERGLEIARIVHGGIFALFTSRQLLEKAYRQWSASDTGRPLFKQGDRSPHELLEDFKGAGNGLLLGTETFWQGVDVPGPALSCVIITRLPFSSPDSPLEEARMEWMAARGMDVFNEYTLPTAVIRFRQGFGRLIRAKTDFGVVAVLDPRIRTKRYGSLFLRSVPACRRLENLEELRTFFASHRLRISESCCINK
jgi:ATP-dependent DNA helicase DinG